MRPGFSGRCALFRNCICVEHRNGNVYYIVIYAISHTAELHKGRELKTQGPSRICKRIRKSIVAITFLAAVLSVSNIAAGSDLGTSISLSGTGSISYWPKMFITTSANKIVGSNNLSLGFQLDWDRWKSFVQSPAARSLAENVGFKLVRVFDFRPTVPRLMPCTYWNESGRAGTWDWTNVDSLVQAIFQVGAEPFFCLGWARANIQAYIPTGMAVDPSTLLPYPDSYASYCVEWVKHFQRQEMPVRYYEVMNEPWAYFGWVDYAKLANFKAVFNAAAAAMRAEDSNVLVGFDGTNRKYVLDYWLTNGGANLGFISFHKYDTWEIGQYSDAEMLSKAQTYQLDTSPSFYGIKDVKQVYYNARGKWIPVLNSESNFNSAYATGTDPKIQQIVGAVWESLVLRKGILDGLSYNIYFEFASSKSWQVAHGTGWGFGMTNQDNNQPWLPYYVHEMIGKNLAIGDNIIDVTSSSTDIRSLAWTHGSNLNILLICLASEPRTIVLQGIQGEITVYRIDNATSPDSPAIQSSTIGVNESFTTYGYTVALVQSTIAS
jgi:hypothetical protein